MTELENKIEQLPDGGIAELIREILDLSDGSCAIEVRNTNRKTSTVKIDRLSMRSVAPLKTLVNDHAHILFELRRKTEALEQTRILCGKIVRLLTPDLTGAEADIREFAKRLDRIAQAALKKTPCNDS